MRSLWRSRKANSFWFYLVILLMFLLSAWMGASTSIIMKTEELKIVGVDFNTDNTLDIHVQNTGTGTVTITDAKVDDTIIDVTDITIDPGESYEVTGIPYAWIEETEYNIAVITNTGSISMYIVISPSS